MIKFKKEDFPIGSYLYFFRICQIQVNPRTHKSGEKRHFKDYVYSKMKITHHTSGFNLIGTEYDNSNEGFDCREFRKAGGHFIVPEWVFNGLKGLPDPEVNLNLRQKLNHLLNDGTGNFELNEIVKNTKTEVKGMAQKAPWHRYNQSK